MFRRVKAWGLGGRQVCVEPKYGDQFDHFSVVFEYANGVRMFGYCRDIPGCGFNSTTDIILGTKGQAFMPNRCRIEGENPWHAEKSTEGMYDVEHQELFESIRQGQPINNEPLHGPQFHAGDPRPDGLLHGRRNHLGTADEFDSVSPCPRTPGMPNHR